MNVRIMDQAQYGIFSKMAETFTAIIENGFLDLLENKHLYQQVAIIFPEYESFIPELENEFNNYIMSSANEVFDKSFLLPWRINTPATRHGGYLTEVGSEVVASISYTPPTIKTYCRKCKRLEPFNFFYGIDYFEEAWKARFTDAVTDQMFILSYQCQSCKTKPEIFVVRRLKDKLKLCGRTPMEILPTPKNLPKDQRKYFSDALIAFNSGQVLAGNFLLRVFIEQYVRSVSGDQETQDIEALFTNYSGSLPKDFKQRFPSLRSIYEMLSVDIHHATASDKIFQQAKEDIKKHFEAKKLYKIPN